MSDITLVPKIIFGNELIDQKPYDDDIIYDCLNDIIKHRRSLSYILIKYKNYLDLVFSIPIFSYSDFCNFDDKLNIKVTDEFQKTIINNYDYLAKRNYYVHKNTSLFLNLNNTIGNGVSFCKGFFNKLRIIEEKLSHYFEKDQYVISGYTIDSLARNKSCDIVIYCLINKHKLYKYNDELNCIIHNGENIYVSNKWLIDPFYTMMYKNNNLLYYNETVYALPSYCQYLESSSKFDLSGSISGYPSKTKYIYKSKMTLYGFKQNCYICHKLNDFCGNRCFHCKFNELTEENKKYDLTGKVALITGGRVKIGFMTSLKMLRKGCTVYVTTRFPNMAFKNYFDQPDYSDWAEKLHIIGCDFRYLHKVTEMCKYLSEQTNFDYIINNAAQTIKPSKEYMSTIEKCEHEITELLEDSKYTKLLTNKEKDISSDELGVLKSQLSRVVKVNKFYDITDHIQIGKDNSWFHKLEDLSMFDILEVNYINQIAPMLIIQQLTPFINKHGVIINVTSREGSFTRRHPTESAHPHTIMTKASLDILTKTLFEEYKAKKIYVHAIDPGYVSNTPFTETCFVTMEESSNRILYPIKILNAPKKNKKELFNLSLHWKWRNFKPANILE